MDGDAGRATWRTDQRFTQCNREEAGSYLRFLASIGYELAPAQQAVANGAPYTGDQPADEPSGADGPTPESTGREPRATDRDGSAENDLNNPGSHPMAL